MCSNEKKTMENENVWRLIKLYFKGSYLERLVRHQLESYNNFVNNQLQHTINMFNPVIIHSEHDKDEATNLYKLELEINFENFQIYRPQIHENNGATKIMFPQEARLRNFTYSSPMTVDLNIKIKNRTGAELQSVETIYKKIPRVHIGKLPIMLKSNICVLKQNSHLEHRLTGECRYDPGGYFIINGSEKTVIAQERAAENRIMCFDVRKGNSKWSWMAEVKSIPDFKCISPKQINLMILSRNNGFGHPMYLMIPRIKKPIPLFIVFRSLGIISDKDICDIILLNSEDSKIKKMLYGLKASIVEAGKYLTQKECLDYIVSFAMYTPLNMDKETGIRKKTEFTENVLDKDLFPHCKTNKQKIYYLGYMTNKLLRTSFGWRKQDDRDSYINKRIDLTGTLLNNLFRNYFNKLVKDMQKQIVREINNGSWRSTDDTLGIINQTNIYKIIKSTTIENGIKRALATGDFGIKNSNSNKVGVAQVLNRLTYIASLSHLRRVNTPMDKSGKLIPPRKLHPTQWGYICPAETPEGQSVGVVKNLSYLTHITINSNSEILYNIIEPNIKLLDVCTNLELYENVKVFINGNWVGISVEPYELYLSLKEKKYKGILNIYTSIVFDYKNMEIRVCNDAGRMTRPTLRVINNNILFNDKMEKDLNSGKMKWDDLMINHNYEHTVLEYIDSEEQNVSMIAMNSDDLKNQKTRYTHCELHPSTIFGILASCIPFPEHNQSPRNTYQCAQGKQALGMYVSNFDSRMDKTAYVQTYTMRPLVDTRIMNYINLHKIPSGSMVCVAIMTYSGFNQEDSIIFNQDSLDRGLFSATIYHTEKDEDKKIYGDDEIRCKPNFAKTKGMKFANYNKLTSKGVIPENTLLENRDIIMGKIVPIKENKNDQTKIIKFTDESKLFRTHEETYVDKNYVNRNGDGYTFCKVRTRTYRVPIIGDKFSSRHGQKGTIGLVLPAKDMPFTADGMRPDLIINPHCIPSRMTIGQLKETILGKLLLSLGLFGDGTSFTGLSVEKICKEVDKLGYEKHGNEIFYNGMTGEQIECQVFFGPVFYQRLKHMVSDKQHARGIGPKVVLTRQPAEGRARDGGLRFGEMERDCMVSHGASMFTKDRIYNSSDKYEMHICGVCGMMARFNDKMKIHHCKTCGNRVNFKRLEIPYAFKLLTQELVTMNIAPRIITEDI